MDEIERERIVTLLAQIGAEMEEASAGAIGAAGLDDQALEMTVVTVLNSVGKIRLIASELR